MLTNAHYLACHAKTLEARHRTVDDLARFIGGWGRRRGEVPSMSGTADAWRIFDLCGTRLGLQSKRQAGDDAAAFVQREIDLLLKKRLTSDPLRHERTVHEIAAGIRLLKAARRPGGEEAMKLAATWLLEARDVASGGWGYYAGAAPQLLPTYHAIWAATALASSDSLEAAEAGRRWILSKEQTVPGGDSSAWFQTDGLHGGEESLAGDGPPRRREPSPVATAWAVLSLWNDDPEGGPQSDGARRGMRWLLANRETWLRDHRYELAEMPGYGVFPAFVLCALACVRALPSTKEQPEDVLDDDSRVAREVVVRVFRQLDDLWTPDEGGWGDRKFGPPFLGTTRLVLTLANEAEARHGWTRQLLGTDIGTSSVQKATMLGALGAKGLRIHRQAGDEPVLIAIDGKKRLLLDSLTACPDDPACRKALAKSMDSPTPNAVYALGNRINKDVFKALGASLQETHAPIIEFPRPQAPGAKPIRIRIDWCSCKYCCCD